MRAFAKLLLIVVAPASAIAQGPPGTNLTVQVDVTGLSMRGDTAQVMYVLRNAANSSERLDKYTVDAPPGVSRIFRPAPQEGWFVSAHYRTRPAALWASLDQGIPAGEDTPPLVFEALGLPGIVTCWITGYYPPSAEIPSDTLPPPDPLIQNSVQDTTVGVVAFPTDLSAANLLARLRSLLDQTCGSALAWITSSPVCGSLGDKLDAASQAVSQGDTATAEAQLQNFLTELEAQHGSGLPVNDSAYWLLRVNAEYILNRRL